MPNVSSGSVPSCRQREGEREGGGEVSGWKFPGAPPQAAIKQLLQLLAYLTLLIIPLSWLALRRLIFSPLRELTTAIEEIDRGNTKYRIPTKATSYEFDQLNRQFNRSIEAVANAEAKAYTSR